MKQNTPYKEYFSLFLQPTLLIPRKSLAGHFSSHSRPAALNSQENPLGNNSGKSCSTIPHTGVFVLRWNKPSFV